MPRDYTDLPFGFLRMYSPISTVVSNTSMNKTKNTNNIKEINDKYKRSRNTKTVPRRPPRAPSSNNPMKSQSPQSVAIAYSSKQQFPMRTNRSERFRNSESIAIINGSIAFDATKKFSINPGLSSTFPWLAEQARKWQQYRFHKLSFRFVTRTSTATIGSVIMSPDYNASENIPVTEQQAANTQDAIEDSPWKEIVCVLDPQAMFPVGPRKNIRSGGIAGDISTYDAGRFFCCTSGMVSAAAIGKLYVDYDVELFVPQSSNNFIQGPSTQSQFTVALTGQVFANNVAVYMSCPVPNYDPLSIGAQAAGLWSPPVGNYRVWGYICVSSSAATSLSGTVQILKNNAPMSANPINVQQVGTSATSFVQLQFVFDDIVSIAAQGDTTGITCTFVSAPIVTVQASPSSIVVNFSLC